MPAVKTTVIDNAKPGALTIAGSGIASVAHMTLETVSHIKEADKVFYLVCDPVTQAFIQDNAGGTHCDLTIFYDKEKERHDSYVQMCEVSYLSDNLTFSIFTYNTRQC